MTDLPDSRLDARYGRAAPWRRTAVVVASGLVGVLGLTWLAWTALLHASPQVSSEIVGWEVIDDHAVTARVDVAIDTDPGDTDDLDTTCRLRAMAADHTVVGEVAFAPRIGLNEVEVRTERRATAVENVGCTTADQPRPR